MKTIAFFLCLLAGPALAQTSFETLVATERAFAGMGEENTTREAFLAYMGDSALTLHEGSFTPAKVLWEKTPPLEGNNLRWAPDMADVSLSGDMGYTAGPWQLLKNGDQAAAGHFVTVWMRNEEGMYRFVVDMGVSYTKPKQLLSPKVKTNTQIAQPGSEGRAELLALDRSFLDMVGQRNGAEAYAISSTEATRILREGRLPFVGPSGAKKAGAETSGMQFTPQGGHMASLGDMGYVFGQYQKGGKQGAYLHVWKHEEGEGWKLVLEALGELK